MSDECCASHCLRCGSEMHPGIAMCPTFSGIPDFPSGEVVTLSAGGPGRLIQCMKCVACGHSVTATAAHSRGPFPTSH